MDLLTELSALPTGLFSLGLGLVLLYWLLFLIGTLDIDALGGADGAMEGAAEGAVEGAAEGAVEGAVEGAAEGAAEGAVEGATEGAAEGAAGMLHALKLRSVPVTVAVSFIVFFAWLSSYLGMRLLGPLLPELVAKLLVFALASVAGVFLASLAVRPFARLFRDHKAAGFASLVGEVVTITTGRVDERFGQASCETGASLILEVRARRGTHLARGDKALLIDFDDATKTFTVEAADPLLLELRDKR